MQERGYDLGFHEIWGHSPLHAPPPPQTEEFFGETSEFIRFWVDFMVKSPDFKIISFCVMIKYRSFVFRKTNHSTLSVIQELVT